MRYAGIKGNDVVNGVGVCVSFWAQGCPHRCPGCHNPQTWDFNGGIEEPLDSVIQKILNAIGKNGIQRNFSLLGGEPFCDENIDDVYEIVKAVVEAYPSIQIFAWTGSTYEKLINQKNEKYRYILNKIKILCDGPFILSQRDITLPLRGSVNQRVIRLKNGEIESIEK